MTPTFAVRRAVVHDAPSMVELSQEAITVSAAEHYTGEQLDAWARRRTLAAHQQMVRDTTAFVAVENTHNTIIGFATVTLTAVGLLQRGVVDQLFVAPTHGGRGVASALLAEVEAAAREAGIDRLVTHASWRAVGVFERCGYQSGEVETVVVDGHELTRKRMHKTIVVTSGTVAGGATKP